MNRFIRAWREAFDGETREESMEHDLQAELFHAAVRNMYTA